MGGEHGAPYAVPDWKQYKVENAPELVAVRSALAQKGLQDPWLRNEVWRYNRSKFGTTSGRARALFFRGFQWGLLAFLGTIGVEYAWEKVRPSEGHGSHH